MQQAVEGLVRLRKGIFDVYRRKDHQRQDATTDPLHPGREREQLRFVHGFR
ncbi:MAG: hypothetical protein F6J95_030625 [Leptolyngbya sp. SIO1E4]|nr:hypothetical protein [Leptolyngbya sp. SIO1E4]